MSRRRFAGQLAAGAGLAGLVSAAVVGAQIPPAPKLPEEQDADESKPPPVELLLLSYLVRNWPSDRYDDESMQGIYRDILGDVARGKLLSDFPLKNSDEPAFVFGAYRAE